MDEMTLGIAGIGELSIGRTVVTGFQGGIDDTVSAMSECAIGTADCIGIPGISCTVVTLFPEIDASVATLWHQR